MSCKELLTEMGPALDRGQIPLGVYGDAELYDLELERVFARNWLFLAHESELPAPGDYVLRYMAEDPWIVVRDEHGEIHVLFDSCRHRGAQVCRADKGNTSHFRCPYHGWTFKNDGTLVGVPNRQIGYKELDDAAWGLIHAPQVTIHRGMIFACLDPRAPSFAEHLGDFAWYLDVHFGAAGGMEVIGDPHRWILPANWKSGAENFSGDSYHTQFLHRSIVEAGLFETFTSGSYDVHVTECSGHASSIRRAGPDVDSFWGYPPDVQRAFLEGDLSPEQLELARASIVTTATVFPNISLIHTGLRPSPSDPRSGYLSLRQWQPRGPGQTEMWSWVLVPARASAEYKQQAYRAAVATFSPSGNFEQDDTIVWTGIARSGRSLYAKIAQPMLNYEMGLNGMSDLKTIETWPGPGTVYDSRLEDGVQRTFFRHWLREMIRA